MNYLSAIYRVLQQGLLVFSSYQYGKVTELEAQHKSDIEKKIEVLQKPQSIEKNEQFETTNILWIFIVFIVLAVIVYILKKIKNFFVLVQQINHGNQAIQQRIEMGDIRVQQANPDPNPTVRGNIRVIT